MNLVFICILDIIDVLSFIRRANRKKVHHNFDTKLIFNKIDYYIENNHFNFRDLVKIYCEIS